MFKGPRLGSWGGAGGSRKGGAMDIKYRRACEATIDSMRERYNAHDAVELASLFAPDATLLDQAWDETREGNGEIHHHYIREFAASPDIRIEERARYVADDSVVTESIVEGKHEGDWRGLPPTGNAFQITVWSVFQFDSTGTLFTTMRYDYDRARIFQQLGLLHDPDSALGKTLTALTHPLTMAKVARKRLSDRPPAPRATA